MPFLIIRFVCGGGACVCVCVCACVRACVRMSDGTYDVCCSVLAEVPVTPGHQDDPAGWGVDGPD